MKKIILGVIATIGAVFASDSVTTYTISVNTTAINDFYQDAVKFD